MMLRLLIVILLGLGFEYSVPASAQAPGAPFMTIRIFNDDPGGHTIFPVLTTGKASPDIWLQAFFKIPQAQETSHQFPRATNYRFYFTDSSGKTPAGIPPGQSVTLSIPLYTQLVATVAPNSADQYIDWWNGGTIQLFSSKSSTPPPALTYDFSNDIKSPVTSTAASPVFPTCTGCAGLTFVSASASLPKNDPSQLIEFTLGAKIALVVRNPATDPSNALDLKNVDFDVSYVHVADVGAAMGPYQNDQVGYVGTPLPVHDFETALTSFLTDFPGWPQFIRTVPKQETILKLASPLEVFARLGPNLLAPPDLTPAPHWPDQLWTPIQALRTNWLANAGGINSTGACQVGRRMRLRGRRQTEFCSAVADVKALLLANYNNYRAIFPGQCKGTPITLSDDLLISHVYGWAPFTEAATGSGCSATANLLENTPPYSANNYYRYLQVKAEFDKLNYGLLAGAAYVFNPWVELIHGQKYVNAPNAYAYSVDDAVGNIQAEAAGFIIDVGSTAHLENPLPAAPPINVNYALGTDSIKFTSYRLCSANAPDKPVNPFFQSFVVNANNPGNCPVYFLDNKSPKQLYTFRITSAPPFAFFQDPSQARWTPHTAAVIDCGGNTGSAPYQQSSKAWCCLLLAGNGNGGGVFAYTTPEPHDVHHTQSHFAITNQAQQSTTSPYTACSMGK